MNDNLENINDLLSKLSEEDAQQLVAAIEGKDIRAIRKISMKNGYLHTIPFDKLIKDEAVEELIGSVSLERVDGWLNTFTHQDVCAESKVEMQEKTITVKNISELIKLDYSIDDKNMCNKFTVSTFGYDVAVLMKAGLLLQKAGCFNAASELQGLATRNLFEMYLSPAISVIKENKVISDINREKASKPRHKLYPEVMSVIAATWESYPRASKTGLLDALAHYYYKKVTRNAIDGWIKNSGLIPPKPDKYSDFELVFPSLAS
ncbi:hypothetical protein [Buttiauxella agrestis]|uniref:hypothetical protein n=1 Tax=Buttiauxella agrestis TaxID=82977 RepID=UPI003976E4E8